MKKLAILVLLLAGCAVGGDRGYVWMNDQVYRPMSSQSQPVNFHVGTGETTDQIARDLARQGLVRNPQVFVMYLRYAKPRVTLQAGDFALDRNMSMVQIVDALQHAKVEQVSVQFPEGYTLAQMAQAAEQAGVGKAADYQAAAADLTWPYDFLQSRPPAAPKNLEGFLFPDSYQLDKGATARDLVKRQLDRFGQVVTPDIRAQAAAAVPGRPAQTLYDIVVLASIVEREVNKDADRPIVCGVFYNRLAKGMPLQTDPAVLYGLYRIDPGRTDPNLTQADLQKDTPYNTYLHKGLPPGPISNPGLASIKSCLAPQKTDYYYFFADPKGVAHYARTLTEFNQQERQFGVGVG